MRQPFALSLRSTRCRGNLLEIQSRMNYSKILNQFKKKKILVIGDLILDRYIWGRVNRISPEAPVPIVEVTKEDFLLGGASNVANNIVALGGHPTIAGEEGNDRAGDVLT